jgi:hypothetical protein
MCKARAWVNPDGFRATTNSAFESEQLREANPQYEPPSQPIPTLSTIKYARHMASHNIQARIALLSPDGQSGKDLITNGYRTIINNTTAREHFSGWKYPDPGNIRKTWHCSRQPGKFSVAGNKSRDAGV